MKYSKNLLVLLLLLTISCQKKTDNEAIKVSGIIKQQGASTYMYGTHILTDAAGNTIYALRSTSVTLDNYIDKNVEIKGSKVKGYPVDGGPDYIDVSKVK